MDKMQVLGKAQVQKLEVGVPGRTRNQLEEDHHYYYYQTYCYNMDIRHERSNNRIRNHTANIPYIIERSKLYIILKMIYTF